ncbi:MAG: cysteine desulfurase [Nanoarchaeota archaeon]
MGFNLDKVRSDFPILLQEYSKRPVHYLDSSCMSLRPKQVIAKENEYYEKYPACAGRSHHRWGNQVTEEVEKAREAVRKFINARKPEEIIFTKNTTEAINLVAKSFPFQKGDAVITLDKEHNSNLLPWQVLKEKGISHIVVKTNDDGTFNMDNFKSALKPNVKLAALGLTANLDGVTIPAKDIANECRSRGIKVLFDGAQYVPHFPTDVRKLDCDFLAFSGHKMCGPSGIGVLYGKKEALELLSPLCIGGETVIDSTYEGFTPEELPHMLEGGLQHYAGIIGLGEACRYLTAIGMENVEKHVFCLNQKLTELLKKPLEEGKISLIGPYDPKSRGAIFNFIIPGMNPHDAAIMLDESRNVMVRSGAHCVHSWFNARKLEGSVRASLHVYNTEDDVMALAEGILELLSLKK